MALLGAADQERLRERFASMTRPVRLLFFTQTLGCETCLQTRQILDELPPLSDRITIEEVNFVLEADKAKQYGIDRVPAIAVVGQDERAPSATRTSAFSARRPATSSSRWSRPCCWSAAAPSTLSAESLDARRRRVARR